MKQIMKRVRSRTPSFFARLRNISLAAVALATALLTAPVALPAVVTSVAGYLFTAGTVATVISQLTVEGGEETGASPNAGSKGGADGSTPS